MKETDEVFMPQECSGGYQAKPSPDAQGALQGIPITPLPQEAGTGRGRGNPKGPKVQKSRGH